MFCARREEGRLFVDETLVFSDQDLPASHTQHVIRNATPMHDAGDGDGDWGRWS
jgi:hypothetical protein